MLKSQTTSTLRKSTRLPILNLLLKIPVEHFEQLHSAAEFGRHACCYANVSADRRRSSSELASRSQVEAFTLEPEVTGALPLDIPTPGSAFFAADDPTSATSAESFADTPPAAPPADVTARMAVLFSGTAVG